MQRSLLCALTCCLFFSVALPAAARVYISEFMASNSQTIADDQGKNSDWIEILNDSTTAVNLAGWHLTDDPLDKTKWRFPAITLGANQRLLVWASNEDERDPARPLHTNFRLDAAGEYLALVRPDGTTVEHEYAEPVPAQFTDVSYGISETIGQQVLVAYGSEAKVKVPPDASEDATWFDPLFQDASWTPKKAGIGFGSGFLANDPVTGQPYIHADGDVQSLMTGFPSIFMRYSFNIPDPTIIQSLTLRMRYDDGYLFYINGAFKGHKFAWSSTLTPDPPRPYNATAIASRSNTAAVVYENFAVPGGNLALNAGQNVLAIHGLNVLPTNTDALFSPELIATLLPVINGNVVYFTTATPGNGNNSGSSNIGPAITEVPETAPPPAASTGGAGSVEGLPLVTSAATGYSGTQGQNGWNWGYMTGSGTYNYLTSYVDFPGGAGAGAWNGTTQWWTGSSWDHNTAGAAPWTEISNSYMHPNDSAPGPREATISRWTSTVGGAHTIYGSFNRASTAGDGTTGRVYRNGTQLFSGLTRGDTQTFTLPVTLAVGDKIDFMVDVGPADDDGSDTTTYVAEIRQGHPPVVPPITINVPVTARVDRTLNDIASVTLKYRVMYANEVSVPMLDDGLNGDVLAGDGIYSGVISTNQITAGQMLRWRVEAADTLANVSKMPPYLNPADDQQYFGTIANDPSTATSLLPVLHWFMAAGTNPDSATPAPVSIYYLGEFYDNCHSTIHGQSSSGFPKKSNDVDGPADHRIRWTTDPNARRVKDINLLSSYADKAKFRNAVGYEAYADAGVKGHFAFPVRLHRNGVFYAVADFVEDGDDRYLERVGLDPDGALYKCYNSLNNATITTNNSGGVEKKTRRFENTADFQAMIDGLLESRGLPLRRQYAYDNINIPALVNYMAATIAILNNDQGHKNYYMYRDTNYTGEWSILPWDVDLSLGHTWTSAQSYWDDDIDSRAGLVLGVSNRLKSLTTSGSPAPEMARMFMRRLRTLMDRWIGPTAAPPKFLEDRFRYWLDIIDPPALGNASDAYLDFKRWGFWLDGGGGTPINYLDSRGPDHQMRPYTNRLINSNPNPPYPASISSPSLGRNSLDPFLVGMRTTLYNPSLSLAGQTIPTPQPAVPPLTFGTVEVNPGSTTQEYFTLRNANAYAVDVSGWTISGGVDFALPGGCVIPPGGGTAENIGLLFVTKDPPGFRARTSGPRAGQYCFCVGPYDGQLSARGESLELRDTTGALIASTSWAPAPTPHQTSLRVTQILFEPNDPTAAELSGHPEWTAQDFEWLELTNIGAASLDLGGVKFTEGIEYSFPAGTLLPAGAKIILAANPTAFALRWPGATVPVVGPYSGVLSNQGETLHVVDSVGESVLEFSYNDKWYPPADSLGHSLVMLDPVNTPFNEWGGRPRWGVSLNPGGQPGAANVPLGMVFEFWQNAPFDSTERGIEAISGLEADPDSDGILNILEYALDTDPKASSQHQLPTVGSSVVGAQSHLTLTFRRQKNVLDLSYLVEASGELGGWSLQGTLVAPPIDNGDGTETVTVRDSAPISSNSRRFIRLRVIVNQ